LEPSLKTIMDGSAAPEYVLLPEYAQWSTGRPLILKLLLR